MSTYRFKTFKFKETEELLSRLPTGSIPTAIILHGDHLYKTSSEEQREYKLIYTPPVEHILLQTNLEKDLSDAGFRKNKEGTICEAWTLLKFMTKLKQGQEDAIESFFAPDSHVDILHPCTWDGIKNLKQEIISKDLHIFTDRCKGQDEKYNRKQEMLLIVSTVIKILEGQKDRSLKLGTIGNMKELVQEKIGSDYTLRERDIYNERVHLRVLNCEYPFSSTIAQAIANYKKVATNYDKRIKSKTHSKPTDWKTLGHALRVADEAVELLKTGAITFPRPDYDVAKMINFDANPLFTCTTLINSAMKRIKQAKEESILRNRPDVEAIERFIITKHMDSVIAYGWSL